MSNEEPVIRYHFIKSNAFRSIHVDGVWGGIGPTKNIEMNIFSQRSPIPRQVVHQIDEENENGVVKQGEELRDLRVSRDGIVREIEASLIISPAVAAAIHGWLGEKLEALDSLEVEESGT